MIIKIHTRKQVDKDKIETETKAFIPHPEAIINEPIEYIAKCYARILKGELDEIHIMKEP
jgi:hypothetical protein